MLKFIKVISENNDVNKEKEEKKNEEIKDDEIKNIKSCQKFFKYGDQYQKSLLSTKNYKLKNKELYDDLIEKKLINSTKAKYIPEYYIKESYAVINKIFEQEKCSNLEKQNIITPIKFFFKKKQIHEIIEPNIDIEHSTVRGTIIDGALSYLYDDTINLYDYIIDCKDINLKKLVSENKIIDTKSAIKEIFGDQLEKIKNKLDEQYKNLKPNRFIYNHTLQCYCNPDLVGEDIIIDIKTSKCDKIITSHNYLQILSYGVLMNIKKVCIYDIINGIIYEGEIKNINKLRDYFLPKIQEKIDGKEWVKEYRTNEYMKRNYMKRVNNNYETEEYYKNDSETSFERFCRENKER